METVLRNGDLVQREPLEAREIQTQR
jgi:hypothetical protein